MYFLKLIFCDCYSPTLYVGEHKHGLYALPTLIGQQSPALPLHPRPMLIEGPNTTDALNAIILGMFLTILNIIFIFNVDHKHSCKDFFTVWQKTYRILSCHLKWGSYCHPFQAVITDFQHHFSLSRNKN